MFGRYECTTNGSNKFWEVSYNDQRGVYIAHHGKIGSKGDYSTYKTRAEVEKKVKEKLDKKGYKLVSPYVDLDAPEETKKVSKKAQRKSEAFSDDLRKASEEYNKRFGL